MVSTMRGILGVSFLLAKTLASCPEQFDATPFTCPETHLVPVLKVVDMAMTGKHLFLLKRGGLVHQYDFEKQETGPPSINMNSTVLPIDPLYHDPIKSYWDSLIVADEETLVFCPRLELGTFGTSEVNYIEMHDLTQESSLPIRYELPPSQNYSEYNRPALSVCMIHGDTVVATPMYAKHENDGTLFYPPERDYFFFQRSSDSKMWKAHPPLAVPGEPSHFLGLNHDSLVVQGTGLGLRFYQRDDTDSSFRHQRTVPFATKGGLHSMALQGHTLAVATYDGVDVYYDTSYNWEKQFHIPMIGDKKVAVYGDTLAISTLEHGIQLYQRMQYDDSNHAESASSGTSIVDSRQMDSSSPTKVTYQLVHTLIPSDNNDGNHIIAIAMNDWYVAVMKYSGCYIFDYRTIPEGPVRQDADDSEGHIVSTQPVTKPDRSEETVSANSSSSSTRRFCSVLSILAALGFLGLC